jgi:hypothetical protein
VKDFDKLKKAPAAREEKDGSDSNPEFIYPKPEFLTSSFIPTQLYENFPTHLTSFLFEK